mmetsp:Transcript_15128/g.28465  ORF Transcript_15128/g.28465 Transcript_15128/m.28465 type:complete len:206 (+) Transcript_15128:62-679(+)
MNYGQKAKELLLELKRSDFIPPYNQETVRSSLSEISLHFKELDDLATALQRANSDENSNRIDPTFRPSLILHDEAIKRNKRCLLAYHVHRLEKLKRLRWDTAAALPSHVKSILAEAEVDFYTEYDRLVSRFNDELGGGLDLNSYFQPPEEDLIEVRVVKSGLGRIVTEYGEVSLELGTTHFLSRGDVEHLIRQGSLQQIDGEEIS